MYEIAWWDSDGGHIKSKTPACEFEETVTAKIIDGQEASNACADNKRRIPGPGWTQSISMPREISVLLHGRDLGQRTVVGQFPRTVVDGPIKEIVPVSIICRSPPPRAAPVSDLTVLLDGPSTAWPGEYISSSKIRITAANVGTVMAPGTAGRLNPKGGYVIALTGPNNLPMGGVFSTDDLAPGQTKDYRENLRIPVGIPPGNYSLCARIDPGNKVAEFNEKNNSHCYQIQILAPQRPRPGGVGGKEGSK